jgi:aldehyde:ferredoxin oxidoreductase
MAYGYNGKILRVDLSRGSTSIDEPEGNFYRKYLGGEGFVSYYLLKELTPGIDPLSPENRLIFAAGVITGAPLGGSGRNAIGAKSPLTGAIGFSMVGGYWGAELKHAGYDAIIIEGKAEKPVYLWINDGKVEIRDARHLWGKYTAECDRIIRKELGDPQIRVAQIGPAGEKLVRYACVINDIREAAGRTGMGAIMGSKNLKAIAIRGRQAPEMADPRAVRNLAIWLRDNFKMTHARRWHDEGTPAVWSFWNREGVLPTRNYREGVFPEGMGQLDGKTYSDTILVGRASCWACPVKCKRVVEVGEPYTVDPAYGGPEYETLVALGSNCGINNLKDIVKAHQLCNAYGLDTMSTGDTIAFAMECFEKDILTVKDSGGLELSFGDAEAQVRAVEMIGRREGLGELLGEGVVRAAKAIGKGAEEYAMHVKGQGIPGSLPSFKPVYGLGLAVSPVGANHNLCLHDDTFMTEGPQLEQLKALGVLEPFPVTELSPAKVRGYIYYSLWRHMQNSAVACWFVPWSIPQYVEIVRGVTGWNTSSWELMKVGERCVNMTRAFNIREGFTREDDSLPERFFTAVPSGTLQGDCITKEKLEQGKDMYYKMMGWDEVRGAPKLEKLQELGIDWVAEHWHK